MWMALRGAGKHPSRGVKFPDASRSSVMIDVRENGGRSRSPSRCDNKIGQKSVDKLPPGSQLFGFCLFRTFEIIVRLHEKKPGTVAIADRTCLLKILVR